MGRFACVPTVICESLGRGTAVLFNLLGSKWRNLGFKGPIGCDLALRAEYRKQT